MRFRKDGIDPIARANAARDILVALPGIWTTDRGCLSAEEGLHTRTTLPTEFGEEDVVERTISIHENLLALAPNVFKLRHESLEIAGGQGEQKPIAGPI
jgi:hypothetical protein